MKPKSQHNEAGFTTVEAAIVVPTVFLMLLLMVQGLYAVLQSRSVQFAAEQAADAAARHEANDNDGQIAALEVLSQLGIAEADIVIIRNVDNVEVTIEAKIPKIVLADMTTTSSASAPIEEFVELGERS